MMSGRIVLAAVLVSCCIAASGCRDVNHKLGIHETIVSPLPGSPEWVIREALAAGLEKDMAAGWNRLVNVIHSEEKGSPSRLNEWHEYGLRRLREAAPEMVLDKSAVTFRLVDSRKVERDLIVYVERPGTVQGTDTCVLRQDRGVGGRWRLHGRCFGW